MIPYGKHSISDAEKDAINQVLASGWLTQGDCVPEFERRFCSRVNVKYACAVNSATSALHLCYLALGVNETSLVWTPANTFVATSNAALMCGATVDFVDIDLRTGNLSIDSLRDKLEAAREAKRLPDVITVVHFAGHPVDLKSVLELTKDDDIKIIEDASHAVGSKYENEPIGNCRYSDAAVFSFHPVKIITTAEGGMITTNDEGVFDKVTRLRSHGIDKDLHTRKGSWEYDQVDLGFNYRMSDIHAALGVVQLEKLDGFISKRKSLASQYDEAFSQLNLSVTASIYGSSSYHLYPILVANKNEKTRIFQALRESGIGVNVHYRPVYLHSYYRNIGFAPGLCPNSEEFYDCEISLPIFPDLTEQKTVIDRVTNLLE